MSTPEPRGFFYFFLFVRLQVFFSSDLPAGTPVLVCRNPSLHPGKHEARWRSAAGACCRCATAIMAW